MKVLFVGTGEAFDARLPNTSVLVESDKLCLMVDCGFSVPRSFWANVTSPEVPHALYVTHLHADHYMGLPALVMRMHEEGRKTPLTILASRDRFDRLWSTVDLGYPGFARKLCFDLVHYEVPQPGAGSWNGLDIRTALTVHGAPNYAVRFDFPEGGSLMVSGDGEITPESAELFSGCSLVVHEAYRMSEHSPGHSSVKEVLDRAAAADPPPEMVALVHTSRSEDKSRLHEFGQRFFVPAPGTVLSI